MTNIPANGSIRFQAYRRRAGSSLSPIGRGMIWGFSLAALCWSVIIGSICFFVFAG